ncbi:MAG: type II toxin-antitoxin system RelE/ParE family toxin [Thermomicrobiales bacterium]
MIRTWLDHIPKEAKVKINALLRRLEVMESLRMPEVRMLHGECDKLMELRREVGNVQYRPICAYGPASAEVTLLIGAIEKGDRFVPKSVCDTAQQRRARMGEKGRTREHDFR